MTSGNISEHFTWTEFLYSETAVEGDISNEPDAAAAANLERLAQVMEKVRSLCGDNPVIITSGYRSGECNEAVGGVPDSAHCFGCACDFVIPEFGDVTDVVQSIQPAMIELGIDQLIHEGTWVHLGLAVPPAEPRHECFAL
jgi:zinc D-Ala-D-Ala carboxypeptidase